jgi:hypothetical protein
VAAWAGRQCGMKGVLLGVVRSRRGVSIDC